MNNTVKFPDELMNHVNQHANNPLIQHKFGYQNTTDFVLSAVKDTLEADLDCMNMQVKHLDEVYK